VPASEHTKPCHPARLVQQQVKRALLITLLGVFVTACGTSNRQPTSRSTQVQVPTPQLAARLLAEGDATQAAHVYAQLANSERDPLQQQNYQLLATELYFDSELYNDGARTFARLPPTMANDSLQQRRNVLAAYNALATNNPQEALNLLPQARDLTDRILRIRALEIQARAQQLNGDNANTLKTRILLEANLNVPESVNLNRNKIRELLSKIGTPGLQRMATTPGGSIYRGWLEYTLLTRSEGSVSPEVFAQRNQNWRSRYPGHPAEFHNNDNSQLPQTGFASSRISSDQIALLLPLSGQFSELGEAIKTGFVGARFEDGGASPIRVYDTKSDTNQTLQQYELATAEGASMIIGPLNKAAVISLAASNRISVPTLSLNYVGDNLAGHSNLYQFGLLPEDEARDVAHYALDKKYKRALVIATDNVLGQRLASAFSNTFIAGGGQVLESGMVSEENYDYSAELKKLLAINSSNSRNRRLETLLDTKIEFEPSIRGDIDVIFMPVSAELARLLRPQLQFHHAGKIPLLSTSLVFSGKADKKADGDLNGIVYNDIPWLLTDATGNAGLFQNLGGTETDDGPGILRLMALGVDAYRLHSHLENMRLDPLYSVEGKTGALSLAEGNQIRRRLQWAEFQEGIPAKVANALAIEQSLAPVNNDL